MNVLVNGCSFSRGPGSWPYKLQELMHFNLINLAQAGAGNTYIYESTVSELYKRKYDLVLIMWSGIERVDLAVNDIQYFDTPYTSHWQSQQNDWAEKIIQPVNDQNYVEKNWVFGCGHINGDAKLLKTKLFDAIYRYQTRQELMQGYIIKIIALQSMLKNLNIPYVFSFYEDYEAELKTNQLSAGVDWNNVCNDTNIDQLMRKNNWFANDKQHPSETAHIAWAKILQGHLNLSTF